MSQNTTLDDNSPFFTYGGDVWRTNHTDDPLASKYSNGTFHTTIISGAWARLCWTGTDISIFGAKRDNHGLYAVVVDNGVVNWAPGLSKDPQIQAVLYSSRGLAQGNHQIVLSNQNAVNATKGLIWLDIDGATLVGKPINCSSLPKATVTPSATTVATTVASSSLSTVQSSEESATSEASTSVVVAAVAATAAEVPTTTEAAPSVPTTTEAAPSVFSISSNASSTSSHTSSTFNSSRPITSQRPTTTVTLESPNISSTAPSTSASIGGTGGAARMGAGVEQVALFGVLGWYLLRLLQ